jgi:hypothetical protein
MARADSYRAATVVERIVTRQRFPDDLQVDFEGGSGMRIRRAMSESSFARSGSHTGEPR